MWLCSGLLGCDLWYMNGCVSAATLWVYRLNMLRILSSAMMGLVCVLGGRCFMSLMIFLCMVLSGWMYVFLVSDVPQMEMLLMRCGYACV